MADARVDEETRHEHCETAFIYREFGDVMLS